MSNFTVSDRECISSLVIATFPSCSFSWGEIALLVYPSLAASEISSSITHFGHSLLWPTLCLHRTPTYQWAWYVHHPNTLYQTDPHLILFHVHQGPSLTTKYHKQPVSNIIGSWHYRVHQSPTCSNLGTELATLRPHYNFTWYLCRCTDTSDNTPRSTSIPSTYVPTTT